MKLRTFVVTAVLISGAAFAQAQDTLMNSAETINKDNFKLAVNPILLLQDPENEGGIGVRAGYGFTRNFDIEAQASFFDGLTFVAADAEWWLGKDDIDISAGVGFHRFMPEGGSDTLGLSATLMLSGEIADRTELYAGLDFNRELPEVGEDYNRVRLIPGIEYKISDDLDFLVEVGIKLNDNATNYVSAGLAYYIR